MIPIDELIFFRGVALAHPPTSEMTIGGYSYPLSVYSKNRRLHGFFPMGIFPGPPLGLTVARAKVGVKDLGELSLSSDLGKLR